MEYYMSKNKELLVEDLMLSMSKPASLQEDMSIEADSVKDKGLKSFVSNIEKINQKENQKFISSKKNQKNNIKK